MTRVLVALVALAALAAHVQAGMTWSPCDSAARPVLVEGVVLTPDPPVIGSPATFLVKGASSVPVQSGSVEIDVSFSGIMIFSTTEDLCTKTSCPVAAGGVEVKLVEDLPPIAPPGEYGLRVTAQDGAGGQELLCLDVTFELVLPSVAAAAAAAATATA